MCAEYKIPEIKPVAGWKELPIDVSAPESNEPLVPVGPFSDYPEFFTFPIYRGGQPQVSPYALGELPGALITPFMRKTVADKLRIANEALPKGYALVVLDTYRPLSVQKGLYDDYYGQLLAKGLDPENASIEAQKMVSIPSSDPKKPSPHYTGASVDLELVKFSDEDWQKLQELKTHFNAGNDEKDYAAQMQTLEIFYKKAQAVNMGSPFDSVEPAVATRYFEEKQERGEFLDAHEQEALGNRRMLHEAMSKAGFSNYPDEWFHYDWGNQFHAIRTGEKAVYSGVELSDENIAFNNMREQHWAGNAILAERKIFDINSYKGIDEKPAEKKSFKALFKSVFKGFWREKNDIVEPEVYAADHAVNLEVVKGRKPASRLTA